MEGVLKFLWKIGIPKTLTKALEGMMNDLCNRAELVKRGNRSGTLRAFSQRITMACAAATITFMKEVQRQKVEIATRKVARVIGVEWTRLRQFRNHIHRGLADNITLRTARFGIRTAKPGCTDLSQRPPARCLRIHQCLSSLRNSDADFVAAFFHTSARIDPRLQPRCATALILCASSSRAVRAVPREPGRTEGTRFGFRIAGSTRRSYQIDRESFGTKMARRSLPWCLPRKSRHGWIVRYADIQ